MIPIAVVLLVLVVAVTLLIGLNSLGPVTLDSVGHIDLALFGLTIPVNEFGLFCCGAGAMLGLVLAVVLLRGGLRRNRASRRKQKELLKAATGQAAASMDRKAPSTRVLPGRAGEAKGSSSTSTGAAPKSTGTSPTDPDAPGSRRSAHR